MSWVDLLFLHWRVEPGPLWEARVEHLDDTLIRAAGLEVSGEPLAWACDGIDVLGWGLIDPADRAAGVGDE